ncbi:MAG TPA: hypothetical protein PKD51_11510 [Saprospiraceae bacterium]|nr:hypothetical protein [Saprospiraceae bacterium]
MIINRKNKTESFADFLEFALNRAIIDIPFYVRMKEIQEGLLYRGRDKSIVGIIVELEIGNNWPNSLNDAIENFKHEMSSLNFMNEVHTYDNDYPKMKLVKRQTHVDNDMDINYDFLFDDISHDKFWKK